MLNNKRGHPDYQDGIQAAGICLSCRFWDTNARDMFGCPAPCSKETEVRESFDDEMDWIGTMASGLECPIREEL